MFNTDAVPVPQPRKFSGKTPEIRSRRNFEVNLSQLRGANRRRARDLVPRWSGRNVRTDGKMAEALPCCAKQIDQMQSKPGIDVDQMTRRRP
jgi:hypothetical protein